MKYTFKDQIKMEQKRIQSLIDLTDPPSEFSKSGSMHIETRGNTSYCYIYLFKDNKRIKKIYLGKPGSEPVRAYAADRFRAEQLRRLQIDQKLLQQFEKKYLEYNYSSIIDSLPKAYQSALSDSAFNARYEEVLKWANEDYPRNTTPLPASGNYAIDGTHTRSKGETLIYNILYEMGIPFRYDCIIEHVSENGAIVQLSPDFMIQCLDGTLIVIEHLGWRTEIRYGIDFGQKCYYYLKKGFILGKNFFVTSDDEYGGTDTHAIKEILLFVQKLFFGY